MIDAPASKRFTETGPRPRREARGISPLVWLNLLCLDAPVVAIAWEIIFARTWSIALPRGATAALFLTAWLIYLADRFGDSLSIDPRGVTSLRQRFCWQHRLLWLVAIGFIAAGDVLIILRQLDARVFRLGAGLGIFAFGYLLLNQIRPSIWQRRPLKEASIGVLFAAGVAAPIAFGLTSAAIPAGLLFAALCSFNCICIAVWESALDLAQARVSIATAFPGVRSWLATALGLICLTSAGLALVQMAARPLWLCLSSSAGFLWLLAKFGARLEPNLRTALADLVLLTPLVVLAFR